jgi:hypothetical protein
VSPPAGTNGAEAAERAANSRGTRKLIAVARASTAALVAILALAAGFPTLAAQTTVDASPTRGDRLSAAAGDTIVETITVEARAANMSTLIRVPVTQR